MFIYLYLLIQLEYRERLAQKGGTKNRVAGASKRATAARLNQSKEEASVGKPSVAHSRSQTRVCLVYNPASILWDPADGRNTFSLFPSRQYT